MMTTPRYRLGCDIGGTFTDFVLLDETTGTFVVHKVLTTPVDPSEAVENGVAALLAHQPDFLAETAHVIHGTTLVINAIIERKGARTAVLATRGFRDILEMRREIRYDIYDIGAVYPTPLVLRDRRREVTERIHSDGSILSPLDETEVHQLLSEWVAEGIESIAVCFLHAYANAAHEQAVATIAARQYPQLAVSLSCEVLPEIKEFERTSTTVVNAYVKPLTNRYLERLERRLRQRGLARSPFLMLSGGGMVSTTTARQFPVRLIESGPVGGVLAAAHLGQQAGCDPLVVFDLGGTTAKACYLDAGQLPVTTEYEVDRVHRFKRGSGIPVGVPTVDLIEVGAGGGSIASINDLGLLQVGPESAGSDPGPICYGRGGTRPTVSDADLVLGYLDAGYFLGGTMTLDPEGARAGIAHDVGEPLGLSVLDAAWGIHEVVNENMASAVRTYVAEKGGDLPNATLVAFGGAGPVHAEGVAGKLGITRCIVPRGAGVYSALGFLVAPVAFEVARTQVTRLTEIEPVSLEGAYRELEAEAAAVVGEAVSGAEVAFARAADMCYAGQGHTIRIALSLPPGQQLEPDVIGEQFLRQYEARYGYAYDDIDVQLVTLRVTATAQQTVPPVALPFPEVPGGAAAALRGERLAYAPGLCRLVPHRVYAVERLGAGVRLQGPAIIEDAMCTLVLGPTSTAEVDPGGWILVSLSGGR